METATTPEPPYYAVVFTSRRRLGPDGDTDDGYDELAERMAERARGRPGFLGMESARAELGITVCYWRDLQSIAAWKADAEHLLAQRAGRARFYARYAVRVARVETAYTFDAEP